MFDLQSVLSHPDFKTLDKSMQAAIRNFTINEPVEASSDNLFSTGTTAPFFTAKMCQDLKRFPGIDTARPGHFIYGLETNNEDLTDSAVILNHLGKMAGLKNSFFIVPLRLAQERTHRSAEGRRCRARDAKIPEQNIYSSTCDACPKRFGPKDDKCKYKAIINCLIGNMGRIACLNISGTALGLFFNKILPDLGKYRPVYKRMLVMNTSSTSNGEFTWMKYDLKEIVDTPAVIRELASKAQPTVMEYYESFKRKRQEAMEFSPSTEDNYEVSE